VLHWSATLVAAVTLNWRVVPAVPELEFIPELAPAELLPGAELAAPASPVAPEALPVLAEAPAVVPAAADEPLADPSCPVTCTSFPTRVRTLSRLPVSL
jgi:hypothetical protein